ncbi:hypothetical protein CBS101457_004947 [Exobasidium rhododendri]|nr:hypothetical protein CBS101457_004947 [Exobasidium rhododendri]
MSLPSYSTPRNSGKRRSLTLSPEGAASTSIPPLQVDEVSAKSGFVFDKPGTRITKVTIFYGTGMLYDGPADVSERVLTTHQYHADLQGHRQVIQRQNIMNTIWTKPATILAVILEELQKPKGEGAEWILWHDADTVLMNPNIHLETYLPPSHLDEDVHLLVTHDQAGLNNGIFFIRVNTWAVELFSSILALPKLSKNTGFSHEDQGAMEHMTTKVPFFAEKTKIVPRHWLNAYPQYNDDDGNPKITMFHPGYLLVHTVAWSKTFLPDFVAKAEQHLFENERSPEVTGLKREVQSYWDGSYAGGIF